MPSRLIPVGLLLILAGLVWWHGRVAYPDSRLIMGDHVRYIAMALQPIGSPNPLAHQSPFLWRLLTPLVVHSLVVVGLPVLSGFWITTIVGLVGATLALQWFLDGLGMPQGATVAGGVAFAVLGPATGFTLFDYPIVDPIAFALLGLVLGATVHRRCWLLFSAAVLGVVAKEIVLLGAVFAFVWSIQQRDRTMFRWAAAALVACLLTIAFIWTSIHATSNEAGLNLPTFSRYWAARYWSATLGAWGLLLPIALLQIVHTPRVWKRIAFPLLLALATAQIFVAKDVARLVVYAFPVVIAACTFEIDELAKHWHCSRWLFWAPILTFQFLIWLVYARWQILGIEAPI